MAHVTQTEIDMNYQFFLGFVGGVVSQHRGKYAVLRDRGCVGIYPTLVEAVQVSDQKYGDGVFSIQEITDSPLDLGFFSHAHTDGGL